MEFGRTDAAERCYLPLPARAPAYGRACDALDHAHRQVCSPDLSWQRPITRRAEAARFRASSCCRSGPGLGCPPSPRRVALTSRTVLGTFPYMRQNAAGVRRGRATSCLRASVRDGGQPEPRRTTRTVICAVLHTDPATSVHDPTARATCARPHRGAMPLQGSGRSLAVCPRPSGAQRATAHRAKPASSIVAAAHRLAVTVRLSSRSSLARGPVPPKVPDTVSPCA